MTDKIDIEKMVREAEKEMFGHLVDTSKNVYSPEDLAMFELVAKKYHEEANGDPRGHVASLEKEHKQDLLFIMKQKTEILHLNTLLGELMTKAKAVIARWDSPDWKDGSHTADYIHGLRHALESAERHNITTE